MPIKDGMQASIEILDLIKAEPHLTNIVALTSYTDDLTVKRCKEIGLKKVYNKPMEHNHACECLWRFFKDKTEEEYQEIKNNNNN